MIVEVMFKQKYISKNLNINLITKLEYSKDNFYDNINFIHIIFIFIKDVYFCRKMLEIKKIIEN